MNSPDVPTDAPAPSHGTQSRTTPQQPEPVSVSTIDRSIVVEDLVKRVSQWALRLGIIVAFAYALARVLGSFWQGILPVLVALIVCTVLAPAASALRRYGLPSALAAATCILAFFGIVGAIVAFLAPSFASQTQSLYLQTVTGIQRLQLWVQGPDRKSVV